MKDKKNFLEKMRETKFSYNKKLLNAIVVSDTTLEVKKNYRKTFKFFIYFYAAIVLAITLLSMSMLSISNMYQQNHKAIFSVVEILVFIVLSVDLSLRWYTSEVRIQKGNYSYFLFPITISGALLIMSLLPSLYLINIWTGQNIQIFKTFESMKFLRIFRIVLLANLIPSLEIFTRVLKKEKSTLYVVFSIVIITILVFALVMYNIEESGSTQVKQAALNIFNSQNKTTYQIADVWGNSATISDSDYASIVSNIKIHNFLDALYFSTVALTTIGFGDISPITSIGKVITIVMSIIGIAVLATPSGVIAGGFIAEIKTRKNERK